MRFRGFLENFQQAPEAFKVFQWRFMWLRGVQRRSSGLQECSEGFNVIFRRFQSISGVPGASNDVALGFKRFQSRPMDVSGCLRGILGRFK